MLTILKKNSPFPPVTQSMDEPNGLLAAGGDLSIERLLLAYSLGIFPWYSEEEPILWWSPVPRTVFLLDQYRPSKSLCRLIRKSNISVTLNHCFESVIDHCAAIRKSQPGTWISKDIRQAYLHLHQAGYAHSIEAWENGQLIGGIYGVSIGKMFCGESMFSERPNGSKIALSCLIGYLRQYGFPMIDCQVENPHLMSLGAFNIKRSDYLETLNQVKSQSVEDGFWDRKSLDVKNLITRTFND